MFTADREPCPKSEWGSGVGRGAGASAPWLSADVISTIETRRPIERKRTDQCDKRYWHHTIEL
jgi:hypothetical protein